ncbi:TetR/AcrR family transcriptional regulator [Nocardia panacis]|uniref:TetR/AcrR family transcriptional regulator n=1 Tax=Nocardia panacis TaxID=2340916 RepID=A0A3A4KH69_9NOCA|nr:QsdR family transcriptional regulator [Nocardia panacis]RJO73819.1 TetR/AcrR family transcriptional regulator [Nocardia panacis]
MPAARRTPTRSPGRPAAATREQVLELARASFLAGERVDVQAIAARLGLSRASIYRWYRSRDGLLGAVMASEYEIMIARAEARRRTRGVRRIVEVLNEVDRWMVRSTAFRHYFDNEPLSGLRVLTTGDGPVQPRVVAAVAALIARTEAEDDYRPPLDRDLLAYALVRLGEAFLYNDSVAGIRGDIERLGAVRTALLGGEPEPR